MKSQTLFEKLKAALKGGEDAKLSRFATKVERYINDQIAIRRREIDDLKDKRDNDAVEELDAAILNVDSANIGTAESMDSFVKAYVLKIHNKDEAVEALTAQIKEKEEAIAKYERLAKLIFSNAKDK